MSATIQRFTKVLTANSTDSSFTNKTPTTTEPTGAGVIVVPGAQSKAPKFVDLVPFGEDADNETFDMRVWGWNADNSDTLVWIPRMLLEVAVTLGNIAQGETTTFMSDVISISFGDSDADVISTSDDTIASILLHLRGSEKIEFDFDVGTAAEGNCYYRWFDQS